MSLPIGDTICALATAPGAAPRAVVRISGPEAWTLFQPFFHSPKALRAFYRRAGQLCLGGWPSVPIAVYAFKAPRSYTCEDMLEVHLPSLPALISALLRALGEAGARQAEPGEFTRRAFLNGRIDLTQAEAVLALTSQEQRDQVRVAARTLRGGLGLAVDAVKRAIVELAAFVEAGIDFSEDEIDLMPVDQAVARLRQAQADLRTIEQRCARVKIHRAETVIALKGRANAGKSTLLNRFLGRKRAITSDQAGTTRDVLGIPWVLEGWPVRLCDVAGDKQAQDAIEEQALEHAAQVVADSDLVLHLIDLTDPAWPERLAQAQADREPWEIVLLNKWDACAQSFDEPALRDFEDERVLLLSAADGRGFERLLEVLLEALESSREQAVKGCDFVTNSRQLALMDRAQEALEAAVRSMEDFGEERWELAMVDIHEVLDALGEITGAVATDDILDVIFGEFCIGK